MYVEDDTRAGERVKGKVIEISLSSLTVEAQSVARGRDVFQAGGNSTFQAERVLQITRVDRRLNGFLIGVAAGAGVGAWVGWGYVNQLCVNEVGECPGKALAVATTISLLGGWIGWEVDELIEGKTLVFARRSTSSSSTLRLLPTVSREATSVVILVSF